MFWANVFVWDGSGGDPETRIERVYRPVVNLLHASRMRQATLAVAPDVLKELAERKDDDVLAMYKDLSVLHQVETALLQKPDVPAESLAGDLNQQRTTVRELLGEDMIVRGVFAFSEKDPFALVETYRSAGVRWVLLDSRNVLGPYVDLLDDAIYELVVPGSVYAFFPDARATRLLREAKDPTARQFKEHFPAKLDRKCYLITVLGEADLLGADGHVWELLEDLYEDHTVRSVRVSTLEELFQKRRRIEPALLPQL